MIDKDKFICIDKQSICALLIVGRVMSILVCLLVLQRSHEVQQLMATTCVLQQTIDHLEEMYGVRFLHVFLDTHHKVCQTPSIRLLFMGGKDHFIEHKHCLESYMRRMFCLASVAAILVISLGMYIFARYRVILVMQNTIVRKQGADCCRPELHRCTWCPDTYCCSCCPEYRYSTLRCTSCSHSICCRCCPAPGCPCCSNSDCCNSMGCICPESHCCVTQGCLCHTNNLTAYISTSA